MTGQRLDALAHVDDLARLPKLAEVLARGGRSADEIPIRMRMQHGGYRPMLARTSVRADSDGEPIGVLVTLSDPHDKDSALRALATLTQANRVLVRATHELELLEEMCRTVVDAGGYLFAWYGRALDDDERTVQPITKAGEHQGYLDEIRVSWGENEFGRGPTGRCLRSGATQVENDFGPDPEYQPWLQSATSRGFHASISLPVIVDGALDGALMVYADQPGTFDALAQNLLEDLAADLGFGIARLRSADALEHARQRFRLIAENASDVVLLADAQLTMLWASPSTTQALGIRPEELIGRSAVDFVHPDDMGRIVSGVTDSEASRSTLRIRYRWRCGDGVYRWVEATGRPLVSSSGEHQRIVGLREIDAQVRAEEQEAQTRVQLESVLGHDQLTELPTRESMLHRIDIARAQLREGQGMAVLCVGVDGLGGINEAFGHAAGDLVLKQIAMRVVNAASDPQFVGRGTGDEFVVVAPNLTTGLQASEIAETIRAAAAGPIDVAEQQLVSTVSIGIASGDRRSSAAELLRDATLALHKAKNAGRDRCEFADPWLALEAQERLLLEADVREGLELGEFMPWFQPIVSLVDGSLVGYEALVRWVRPGREELGPKDFMLAVERTPLITDVDRRMLTAAVAALGRAPSNTFISVNVAAGTMDRAPYAQIVEDELTSSGIDPARLHLEITETMLLSTMGTIPTAMTRIADMGVRWYVDDFGTGFSSISHLRDLPIAGIKLDQSFTRAIGAHEPTSMRVAAALSGLATGLELDTIAEGVETQAEADYLLAEGWRHGQGWLYGKASPLG